MKRPLDPRPSDDEEPCPSESEEGAAHWVETWRQARAAGGDGAAAFRRIYEHYYRPLWRFFSRRGFAGEECHDLTQETFVRVYTGMDGFRGEARFETWLFRVALNTYRKSLRYGAAEKRAGRELSLEDANGVLRGEAETAADASLPMADPPPQPLAGVLGKERRQALLAAVAELPEQMRRCVVLRIYQERPYKEIAEVMRISVETVKAHLFQARRRLRAALGDHFEDFDL